MILNKIKKNSVNQHIVIVGDKKTKLSKSISESITSFFKDFLKGEKETDFLKTPESFYFFVKTSDNNEKLRIAGSDIRNQLPKDAEEISIIGESDKLIYVAEGLALSNYQFLKYFKDSEVKRFKLKSINLQDDVDEKDIDSMNNTIKAVYWARNMVNEPVSFLTATKLSEEIEGLSKDSDLHVEVLEKTKNIS